MNTNVILSLLASVQRDILLVIVLAAVNDKPVRSIDRRLQRRFTTLTLSQWHGTGWNELPPEPW